jgi:hypothetical protein
MSEINETHSPKSDASPPSPRPLRLPSARASLVLATVMLALGVAVGAAIGPAPDASFANSPDGIAQRLPQLIALLANRAQTASATPPSAPVQPPAVKPQATPRPASVATTPSATTTTTTTTPSATTPGSPEEESTPPSSGGAKKPKLPAITNVWLIELDGTGFTEAKAQASAAPYITGTLIPASTLLSGWSALSASAFASEAALAAPPAAGATPPLLHSIVQPPCPEGAAGAACAPGTPGQLTAADEFLKATLATITGTPSYREHGLIVVTFATVAIASQSGLPASASNATLTYEPPAGAALLSPFAKPGSSATPFNPTSPRQSLEKLLH